MQFNNTSSEEKGIIQDITFWTGADTSSNAYPMKDRTRSVNERYKEIATSIMEVDSKWVFDDENNTTLPEATTNLVDGQQDYSLPTNAFQIRRVRIKDENGDWHNLDTISESERDYIEGDNADDKGRPQGYWEMGHSLFLYPVPDKEDVTLTDGLKLNLSRGVDSFSVSDTSKTPGFHENFHRMLSIGASIDYMVANQGDQNTLDRLQNAYTKYESSLRDMYGDRNEEELTVMEVKSQNTI